MKKTLLSLCVLFTLLLSSNLYAQKADVTVKKIVKGSYFDYVSSSLKEKIVTTTLVNNVDWVGKSYASKNDIDENKLLNRAQEYAQNYAIGFSGGYLGVINSNYNPSDYYIVVDNYEVSFTESDYKYSTTMSANIILFKK